MHFMTAGDKKYAFLIRENCTQVRALYPDAPIWVYDFGMTEEQRVDLTMSFPHLSIIDWREKLNTLPDAWLTMDETQKRKLALAFNARKTGWRKRLKKAVFKRFPDSPFADAMKDTALKFENLLIQKIACMRDASARAGTDRLVFLDADAMLFKPIDDAFDDEADITLTLLKNPVWEKNACFVINSGVIYFSANEQARNSFLDAWWDEVQVNDEWLREQTAMVRMIERQIDRAPFAPGQRPTVTFADTPVRLRFESCEDYNFFNMENVEPEDFPDSRVYHFTGRRQQPAMFAEIMVYLRAHRGPGATQ